MNRTIMCETRELLLNLLCVDLNRLSEQTRTELRHVAGIDNRSVDNAEEMIEQPNYVTQEQTNVAPNSNQIVPQQTI